jgi:hypothetical protein
LEIEEIVCAVVDPASLSGVVHACSFWAIWCASGRVGTGWGAGRPSSSNAKPSMTQDGYLARKVVDPAAAAALEGLLDNRRSEFDEGFLWR